MWSHWTVTQSGLSWLEACTFTITHTRGLLLGTRNRIEELDSIWNHVEPFCCTMTATEIKQLLCLVIQSKTSTLSIVVSFDIQSIEIDRQSSDMRFLIYILAVKYRNLWFHCNNRSEHTSICAMFTQNIVRVGIQKLYRPHQQFLFWSLQRFMALFLKSLQRMILILHAFTVSFLLSCKPQIVTLSISRTGVLGILSCTLDKLNFLVF